MGVEVITYLHNGPHVCHRDVKPENILVNDLEERILIKIADFDLALVQDSNTRCSTSCGTVPFTAPEVQLACEYNGFSADVWSLGIVLLEILCSVRILETVLKLCHERE